MQGSSLGTSNPESNETHIDSLVFHLSPVKPHQEDLSYFSPHSQSQKRSTDMKRDDVTPKRLTTIKSGLDMSYFMSEQRQKIPSFMRYEADNTAHSTYAKSSFRPLYAKSQSLKTSFFNQSDATQTRLAGEESMDRVNRTNLVTYSLSPISHTGSDIDQESSLAGSIPKASTRLYREPVSPLSSDEKTVWNSNDDNPSFTKHNSDNESGELFKKPHSMDSPEFRGLSTVESLISSHRSSSVLLSFLQGEPAAELPSFSLSSRRTHQTSRSPLESQMQQERATSSLLAGMHGRLDSCVSFIYPQNDDGGSSHAMKNSHSIHKNSLKSATQWDRRHSQASPYLTPLRNNSTTRQRSDVSRTHLRRELFTPMTARSLLFSQRVSRNPTRYDRTSQPSQHTSGKSSTGDKILKILSGATGHDTPVTSMSPSLQNTKLEQGSCFERTPQRSHHSGKNSMDRRNLGMLSGVTGPDAPVTVKTPSSMQNANAKLERESCHGRTTQGDQLLNLSQPDHREQSLRCSSQQSDTSHVSMQQTDHLTPVEISNPTVSPYFEKNPSTEKDMVRETGVSQTSQSSIHLTNSDLIELSTSAKPQSISKRLSDMTPKSKRPHASEDLIEELLSQTPRSSQHGFSRGVAISNQIKTDPPSGTPELDNCLSSIKVEPK